MKNLQKGLIFFGLFALLLCLNNCSFFNEIICNDCPIAGCEPENVALDSVNNKYKKGELVVSYPKTSDMIDSAGDSINIAYIKNRVSNIYQKLPENTDSTPIPLDSIEVTKCICDEQIFLIISNIIIGSENNVAEAANTTEEIRDEGGIFSLNYLVGLDIDTEGIPKNFVTQSEIPQSTDSFATNYNDPLIAILDSGIDFTKFEDVSGIYTKTSLDQTVCSISDDTFGYNFVDPNNPNRMIQDANGHGTVVSLAYKSKLDRISALPTTSENLWKNQRMLTVKVLDDCGYGTIFSTTCGLAYARLKGANIINCSWGLYFNDAQLQRAISQIPDQTAIVCSAGNDTVTIGGPTATHVHFPSGYGFPFTDATIPGVTLTIPPFAEGPEINVYEVLALDNNMDYPCPTSVMSSQIAIYSNKRPESFAEPGNNVQYILNENPCPNEEINGTSFAAPSLAAGLVYRLNSGANFTRGAAVIASQTVGTGNKCLTRTICN